MDRWEYRVFRLSVKAAEDPASYDALGAEGWELAALTGITRGTMAVLTRNWETDWVLAVFKRRVGTASP